MIGINLRIRDFKQNLAKIMNESQLVNISPDILIMILNETANSLQPISEKMVEMERKALQEAKEGETNVSTNKLAK